MLLTQMVTGKTDQYYVIDSSLTNTPSEDIHLSIEIGINHVSWALHKKSSDQVFAVSSYQHIRAIDASLLVQLLKDEQLPEEPASVSFSWRGYPVSLVPAGLLMQDSLNDFHNLGQGATKESLTIEEVNAAKLKLLYHPDEKLEVVIKNHFPNAVGYSNTALVIDNLLRKNSYVKQPQVFLEVADGNTECYCLMNGKFRLYNSFPTDTTEDILYYLAGVANHLKVELQDLRVYLGCDWSHDGPELNLLKEYIKQVQINMGYQFVKATLGMNDLKKQRFVSLLNQYACVS